MDNMNVWTESVTKTLGGIMQDIGGALPGIMGAIIIAIFGWLATKIILWVLRKAFKVAKIDTLSKKLNEAQLFGDSSSIKIDVAKILLSFVKWVLILIIIILASDIMGLTIISEEIANLLRYLPVLLSAVVIFAVGMYAARLIRSAITGLFDSMGFGGSKVVGSIVFYLIVIFVLITSLNQAGIDTSIITNNFTLVLGAFLLTFALGAGLGSREVVGELLKAYYARKNFAVGDKVQTKKIKGTITAIGSVTLTVKNDKGSFVVPIKDFMKYKVKIETANG